MPDIILAVVMFAAGLAAGWLCWEGRLKAKNQDIRALEEQIATLRKSRNALQGAYRRAVA